MILTADWHLDDSPANEYRWSVFNAVENASIEFGDRRIFVLGDICDRKDRHSGELVNRLVSELLKLSSLGLTFVITKGNHDNPMAGAPFWRFLNFLQTKIEFHEQPKLLEEGILLLPYSSNPKRDWSDIDLGKARTIFMHQTVSGVRENGITLTNEKLPPLPRGIPIYSGDIHTPQTVGNVTYISAPHPVKFGDSYESRMLRIDEKFFKLRGQFDLFPPRKVIAEISNTKELDRYKLKRGDQVKIRWHLPVSQMDRWTMAEEAVMDWVDETGVTIASLEPIILMEKPAGSIDAAQPDDRPIDTLQQFAEAEGIDGDLKDYGFALMERAKGWSK